MPNCYRCGRFIEPGKFQFRRKVRVGETVRSLYGRGKVASATARFGVRVVCRDCARTIDHQEFVRRELPQLLELALALAVLAGAAVAALFERLSR